ncbi:MAG: rhomboid family intramembrane serine protease [Actinobacteria bacterium RBG_16_67_10]|nr:MAG: rhomboid family intramembrane serine protease [Actinobacteria bacterium RBG_16_67_10]
MIPISDDDSDRTLTPFINYLLIAANIAVFVLLQGMGASDRFTYAFSTVPKEIVTGKDIVTPPRTVQDPVSGRSFEQPGLQHTPVSVYLTLLVSMFMHGGIAHIAGNMLYLWIFGDNLENALGRLRYVTFYLVCGVLASLAHVFTTVATHGNTLVPSLGASGAISGVLGGYILLFPGRRVRMLMGRSTIEMPAWVSIGMWFLFQLVAGMGLLGGGSQAGGVAYAAHVGGFIAGLILVKVFAAGRTSR